MVHKVAIDSLGASGLRGYFYVHASLRCNPRAPFTIDTLASAQYTGESKGEKCSFPCKTMIILTLTSKGVNKMTNRRTGENKRQEHKNYLARYRRLIKMQKIHYNKWIEVSKELAEFNPHLERSKHGNG